MAEIGKNYEYSNILKNLLKLVPDTIDKREGSILYDTLAPAAYLIARQNYMLGYLFDLLFADTASGDWLDRVTNDFGVNRDLATKAIRQIAIYNTKDILYDAPIGCRFAVNELTFRLTEKIETGKFRAECEQAGTIGNCYSGAILPVDFIGDLGHAELASDPLLPAHDDEEDESLRERFYIHVRATPFGGNIADYEEKVLRIEGVGKLQAFAAPVMGPGRVGLVITDELGEPATQMLIDRVKEVVKEEGEGIAPVGHRVTVRTCAPLAINIIGEVKLRDATSFDLIKPKMQKAIEEYLQGIPFGDETVFYSKIIATMLDADRSIRDVTNVTVNSQASNLKLDKQFTNFQVARLGNFEVTKMQTEAVTDA